MTVDTPLLFIVFNRPAETSQVFSAIQKVRPAKLYIAADGPRQGREDDALNCARVREIVSNITWPCQVKTLFRDSNAGCRLGVSGAIDWFFENEEEGIILEDDCLPDETFYTFCRQLLERYRDDMRVYAICGRNPVGSIDIKESYLFSRFFKEWGWASWRRAWVSRNLDKDVYDKAAAENLFERTLSNLAIAQYTQQTNRSVHYSNHNTWDFQWTFNIMAQNGLVIVPRLNLVDNIGLDTGVHFGTNPKIIRQLYKVAVQPMPLPLIHPSFVFADTKYDEDCFFKIHPYLLPKPYTLSQRIMDSLKFRLGRLFNAGR